MVRTAALLLLATPAAACPPGAQAGLASWYGAQHAGRVTASGERFNPHAMTAAHLWLPMGTLIRVVRADGKAVTVRITDRGPRARCRVLDLSQAAARALG